MSTIETQIPETTDPQESFERAQTHMQAGVGMMISKLNDRGEVYYDEEAGLSRARVTTYGIGAKDYETTIVFSHWGGMGKLEFIKLQELSPDGTPRKIVHVAYNGWTPIATKSEGIGSPLEPADVTMAMNGIGDVLEQANEDYSRKLTKHGGMLARLSRGRSRR